MTTTKGTPRICGYGHRYYKSSDCPTCPVCEADRVPEAEFLAALSAPARRALENEGITTISKLATYTEAQILGLHGMGPGSLPKLRKALDSEGMSFKGKK